MKCAKHGTTTANRLDMTVRNSFVVVVFSLSRTRSSFFSLSCLRPVTVLYAHGFDGINEFPNESACCTRVHAPSLTHSNAYAKVFPLKAFEIESFRASYCPMKSKQTLI